MAASNPADENYTALIDILPQMANMSLDERLSKDMSQKMKYIEGDFGVNFIDFAKHIRVGDAQKLYDWRSTLKIAPGQEENFDRHFISEHFKMHTNQAKRSLEKSDLDTLMWIKSLYAGAKPHKAQPLPFPKDNPLYFWHHLCTVESTVRSIHAVWCMTDPNVVFGFLPRADAVDVMRASDSRVGTFFFRLSNSDPSKLCLVWCASKENIVQIEQKQNEGELSKNYKVKQELVDTFKSMTQFKDFLGERKTLINVLPDKNGNVKSRQDFVGVVSDNVYLADIKSSFEQWGSAYTIVFSDPLKHDKSFEESKDDFQPGMMDRMASYDKEQGPVEGNSDDLMAEMGNIYAAVPNSFLNKGM